MHGGFQRLVHPGTPSNEIDVEGTRQQRARINAAIRRRQQLIEQLAHDIAEPLHPEPDQE